MSRVLTRLVLPVALTLAAAVIAPAPALAADAVPGQLVVGFHGGLTSGQRERLVEHVGGRLVRHLSHIRGGVVRVRKHGLALSVLRRRLIRARGIRYAEPDYYVRRLATPDDPLYTDQWALGATTTPGAANAPGAWSSRTSCAKVAVLDTGTQYNHPDLTGNVWHNSHEIAGNNVDDDHNGYIDDYYGVDLVSGRDSGNDDDGHGTHVSGIIAGHGNNDTGVSGLCWTGLVVPVKFMNSQGKGSSSAAATALDYAVTTGGAKIVNGSFGSTSKSSALADEVSYAQSKGVLCVFAAGNNGTNNDSTPEYPAALTNGNIIAVAAVTTSGALASFSNYGPKSVDLGAPGNNIISTYLGSTYKVLSGTSMASPIVAATAAMIRQKNSSLTYSQIRSAILSTTHAISALNGKLVHPGVLNAAYALDSAG